MQWIGTGLDFANLDEKRVETFWHDQFGGYVTTIEEYEEKIKEKIEGGEISLKKEENRTQISAGKLTDFGK